MSGTPEARLTHNLSKFHRLIHELYPTNHHSSREWNVLPPSCFPESYNLPSFKSKISNLDLICLSSFLNIIIIVVGQVSSSILPEFAWLHRALQIFQSLVVFGRSSTAKFGLRQVSRCILCEVNLDELSHGLASTELACCMFVVQRDHNRQSPVNFKRLPQARKVQPSGLLFR